jgi:hypothetical protein
MKFSQVIIATLILAVSASTFAAKPKAKSIPKVNNYPTLDRVQYVLECVQNYPDKVHQEMIYKCSCAIDEIAKQIGYDDFINDWTSSKAITIAGDRGAIREHQMVKGMVKEFKDVQGNAQKICLFN